MRAGRVKPESLFRTRTGAAVSGASTLEPVLTITAKWNTPLRVHHAIRLRAGSTERLKRWMPARPTVEPMTNDTASDDLRKLAKKRLKAKQDFKQFLGIWLGVSLLLLAIWALTSYSTGKLLYFWPVWPIGGMGVAAFFMVLDAYGPGQRGITEADIDAEVERMQRRNGGV